MILMSKEISYQCQTVCDYFLGSLNMCSLRTSTQSPFVLTSAMKKSFEMVCMAVSQKWPVLLYGPAGAGKTKLIRELAWDSGNQGMVLLFSLVFMHQQ